MKYKLSMFNFDLPEKLITDTPAKNRDDAKLMVLHRESGEIEHKKVDERDHRDNCIKLVKYEKIELAKKLAKIEQEHALCHKNIGKTTMTKEFG